MLIRNLPNGFISIELLNVSTGESLPLEELGARCHYVDIPNSGNKYLRIRLDWDEIGLENGEPIMDIDLIKKENGKIYQLKRSKKPGWHHTKLLLENDIYVYHANIKGVKGFEDTELILKRKVIIQDVLDCKLTIIK